MIIILILIVSILLQFVASGLSLRLIKVTGKRLAWLLISTAIFLMALRRCITLYHLLSDEVSHVPDLMAECVALVISILMVIGISQIGPYFSTIRRSEKELQSKNEALSESEEHLRSILDNATAVIYIKDIQHRYILINRQFENLFGVRNEDMKGKTDHAIFPIEEADTFIMNNEIVLSCGRAVEFEEEVLQKDGMHTYLSVKSPIRNTSGVPYAVCGISTDITQRKKAETKMNSYSAELERSNQELENFAYIASHDLQEPLRKIVSFGDRLMELAPHLDDKAKDYLIRMQKSSFRMKKLIDDLLQLSRVTKSKSLMIKLNLGAVVAEVLEDLESQISRTNGTVKVKSLPTVEANFSQMKMLFQNLISNGLKFYHEGVPPIIEISSLEKNQEGWEIRVKDKGVGFEQIFADRIFLPFERLHQGASFEGTGIGLAICKKIVEFHHGSINVETLPDHGSTFTIFLPEKQTETV